VIERRLFVGALASSFLAAPFATNGQPTDKIWRLGYLGMVPAGASPETDRLIEAFLHELRQNGFVEGKNLILERRAIESRYDRIPALVAELIGLRVDVLVIVSNVAARAAKEATTTPIVMPNMTDPVAGGLIYSLARPGGNVTGVTAFDDDLNPKRLELLKAVAPKAVRVAFVLGHQPSRIDASQVDELNKNLETAARSLGISLVRVLVSTPHDVESAAVTIARERADAMLIGADSNTMALRKEIADIAIRQRLPSIVPHRSAGTGGALMSYGPDLTDNFREAATYVAKILNGANPADLPVKRPTKPELVINLKTAKAIGLPIPQAVLLRADEVIQ